MSTANAILNITAPQANTAAVKAKNIKQTSGAVEPSAAKSTDNETTDFSSKLKEAGEQEAKPEAVSEDKAQGSEMPEEDMDVPQLKPEDELKEALAASAAAMPIQIVVDNIDPGMLAELTPEAQPQAQAPLVQAEQNPIAIVRQEPAPVQQTAEKAPVIVQEIMQEVGRAAQAENKADAVPAADQALESQANVAKTVMIKNTPADAQQEQTGEQKEGETAPKTAQSSVVGFTAPAEFEGVQQAQTAQQTEAPQQVREVFIGRLVDQVTTAVSNEKSELTIQLKPEHLGGLNISLTMTEKGLEARLTTSSQEVQSMLHSELAALQQTLRDKGINVVNMEIIYDQMTNMEGRDLARENSGGYSSQTGRGGRGGEEAVVLDLNDVIAAAYEANILEPESSREYNA